MPRSGSVTVNISFNQNSTSSNMPRIPVVPQPDSKTKCRQQARPQFFALGTLGGFLGHLNPLSAGEVFQTCVIPALFYGAENWILDDRCLNLLESFQAETSRRILRLSQFHSGFSVRIGLALPSVAFRILKFKISYLQNLLTSENNFMAAATFRILTMQDVYDISLVKQCIFLDSKIKSNKS